MEGSGHAKDRFTFLDGFNPASREAPSVSYAVDLIENRTLGISRAQKIAMKRVGNAVWVFDCSVGSDQGLPDDLTAIDALPTLIRTDAAK